MVEENKDRGFTPFYIVSGCFGFMMFIILGLFTWMASNVSHIPVIESQITDMGTMRAQIAEISGIKVKIEDVDKKLEVSAGKIDNTAATLQDLRIKQLDHEERIKYLENTANKQ